MSSSEPESSPLRPGPVRGKRRPWAPKEAFPTVAIQTQGTRIFERNRPARPTLLSLDPFTREGAPDPDSTAAPPHAWPRRKARHRERTRGCPSPRPSARGYEGPQEPPGSEAPIPGTHRLGHGGGKGGELVKFGWEQSDSAENAVYTGLGLRGLGVRTGSLASVGATAPLPANGPRLHKPHPGKSRPRRTARSFMWPGFRTAPRPRARLLAGRGPRPAQPSPALPCLATPATWGPGWAWAPRWGLSPLTWASLPLSHPLHVPWPSASGPFGPTPK